MCRVLGGSCVVTCLGMCRVAWLSMCRVSRGSCDVTWLGSHGSCVAWLGMCCVDHVLSRGWACVVSRRSARHVSRVAAWFMCRVAWLGMCHVSRGSCVVTWLGMCRVAWLGMCRGGFTLRRWDIRTTLSPRGILDRYNRFLGAPRVLKTILALREHAIWVNDLSSPHVPNRLLSPMLPPP
jgi:hypothetical protein